MIIEALLQENRALLEALSTQEKKAKEQRAKHTKLKWDRHCDVRNLECRCEKYQAYTDEAQYERQRMATVRLFYVASSAVVWLGSYHTKDQTKSRLTVYVRCMLVVGPHAVFPRFSPLGDCPYVPLRRNARTQCIHNLLRFIRIALY